MKPDVFMQVLEHLNVDHLPPEEQNPHVVRVGFSALTSSLTLGKTIISKFTLMLVIIAVDNTWSVVNVSRINAEVIRLAHLQCESLLFWSQHLSSVCLSVPCQIL